MVLFRNLFHHLTNGIIRGPVATVFCKLTKKRKKDKHRNLLYLILLYPEQAKLTTILFESITVGRVLINFYNTNLIINFYDKGRKIRHI